MRALAEPILIWGAGAIGGTIGAYLIRAGHQVTLVDRAAEHVEQINRAGLKITGPIEEFSVRTTAFEPEQLQGQFSTTLLAVKAHHTVEAVTGLARHLSPDGLVVSAQNGLNELEIAKVVGESRTIGCFVNFGADYLEPGVIHFGGRGAVVVGELDGRMTPRLQALHELLRVFEPNAIQTDNIWGYLWGKMAYGAQLFATALSNASIVESFESPQHHGLFIALAREIMRVAEAKGVRPEGFNGFNPNAFTPSAPPELAEQSIQEMVVFNRRSAKTHSGIWRDLAVRKRQTEVDAQLGPIVSIGQQVGVATPITARLIEMIHQIESGQRPLDWANLGELEQAMARLPSA